MGEVRDRVRAAVQAMRDAAVTLGEDLALRSPAPAAEVDAAAAEFGHEFPEALRELYLIADGQSTFPAPMYMFGDVPFMPLHRALAQMRFERDYAGLSAESESDDDEYDADPEIRPVSMHHARWPFAFPDGQLVMYIDAAPTGVGQVGQLMVAGSHFFEPFPWIAPSLLEFLEAWAAGIRSGLVTARLNGQFGGTRWGLGPAAWPLEYSDRALFRDPEESAALDGLSSEWSDWALHRGPRFAALLEHPQGLVTVPSGTRDLAPIARWPELRWLDLGDTTTPDIRDIPDLPKLVHLRLRGAVDLTGLARFPLNSLWIVDSPDVDLTSLSTTSVAHLEIDGSWKGVLPVGTLSSIAARVNSPIDAQRAIDARPTSILRLDVGDSDVDVAALDWAGTTARHVDVAGGTAGSMSFLSRLEGAEYVSFTDQQSIDLAGMPESTTATLTFRSVTRTPSSVDALSRLHPPAGLIAPAAWWHALHDTTDPLIWGSFTDVEENSDEQRLGWKIAEPRDEWLKAYRARKMEERLAQRRDSGLG